MGFKVMCKANVYGNWKITRLGYFFLFFYWKIILIEHVVAIPAVVLDFYKIQSMSINILLS